MIQITGVLGAAGVPAAIPVEETRPGPGSVSEETVPRLDLDVKEPALRLKIVITLTKVVIVISIYY